MVQDLNFNIEIIPCETVREESGLAMSSRNENLSLEMVSPTNQISINVPNYSGPLDLLLDLAKTQKVDLLKISMSFLPSLSAITFLNSSKFLLNLSIA